MQLYHPTCQEAAMITWVQLLEGATTKFLTAKTWKIWRDFGQVSTLIANISGTDRHNENLTTVSRRDREGGVTISRQDRDVSATNPR